MWLAVYDTTTLVNGYGTIKLYRNGVLMDHDNMSDYSTVPVDGVSPLRLATRDFLSFFKGAIGQVAVYDHAVPQSRLAAHYTAMMEATSQSVNAQNGTAYTLVPGDAGRLVTLSNAGAVTLTVPGSAFATGQRIDCIVLGAGMVTVAGATGATVNGTPSLTSRAQYSAFSVVCLTPSSFVVVGDLA